VVANGGTVAGRRLVVVGAGNVAAVAVARAVDLGAIVTVCNRTRRSADRFVAAGAKVVDLADLADCLATNDIAILATAAPHPLVDAGSLRSARPAGAGPLTLVDLSLPRNVDPSVRALPSVRLIDLADLRAHGTDDARDLAGELAATEEVIEAELRRYLRWLESRSAATALRRMRRDAEDIAREELARITDGIAAEIHSPVEQALLRTVHRLVHGPTQELLAAARAGDTRLVNILAGLYGSSQAGDPDATTRRLDRPAFDARRTHACPFEQAADECGVHPAHEVAM
jgi:glutamyl-tRNA reductase